LERNHLASLVYRSSKAAGKHLPVSLDRDNQCYAHSFFLRFSPILVGKKLEILLESGLKKFHF
jgi:hypothetical protein